jgi:hypothetical protein
MKSRTLQTAVIFFIGLACGLGIGGRRLGTAPTSGSETPPEVPRAVATAPQDLVAASDAAVKAMSDATDRVLAKLAESSLPIPDKVIYIRTLGRLGTPKAISYLLDNHAFTVRRVAPDGVGEVRLPATPCIDALMDAGAPAVPRMVEAYCTWPPEKDPQCLLFGFTRQHPTLGGERSRVAYLLAQGYLFAYQDKHFHRERTLELIYSLVPHATDEETLIYPAPWMPNHAKPDAVVPKKLTKKP